MFPRGESRWKSPWGGLDLSGVLTHNHAEPDLLSAVLLLDCLVQHDVQEDLCLLAFQPLASSMWYWAFPHIVSAEHADDFAAAVELDKEPLVEILSSHCQQDGSIEQQSH